MLVAATQAKQDSSLPLPTATTNNELSSIASLKHRPTFVDDEVVMPVPTTAAELLCIRASALLARKIRGLEDMDEYEEPRRITHQYANKLSAGEYDEQSLLSTKKHVSALIDSISADPSLYYNTLERRARERATRGDGTVLGFFKSQFARLYTSSDQPMLSEASKKTQADALKTKMFQVYEYGTGGRNLPVQRPRRKIPPTRRELLKQPANVKTAADASSSSSSSRRRKDAPSVEALRINMTAGSASARVSAGAGAGAAVVEGTPAEARNVDAGAPSLNIPPRTTAELLFAPEPQHEQPAQDGSGGELGGGRSVEVEGAGGDRVGRSSKRIMQRRKSSKRLSFEMQKANEIGDEAPAAKRSALQDRSSADNVVAGSGNAAAATKPSSNKVATKSPSLLSASSKTEKSAATTSPGTGKNASAFSATLKSGGLRRTAGVRRAGVSLSTSLRRPFEKAKGKTKLTQTKLSKGGKKRVKELTSIYGSAR